jgi:hypothetical protein
VRGAHSGWTIDNAPYFPPLTDSTWPVIRDAYSEARNRTACAMSAGELRRRRGMLSISQPRSPKVGTKIGTDEVGTKIRMEKLLHLTDLSRRAA